MMRPLYEIAEDLRQLAADIEDNGGELTPELEARFDSIGGEFQSKADHYCGLIRDYEAYAEALGSEISRMADRKRAAERTADTLRGKLLSAMESSGQPSVRGHRFTASVALTAESYHWTGDPDAIPPYLRRIKVEFDKTAAKSAHKAGVSLPAEVDIRRSKTLRIK